MAKKQIEIKEHLKGVVSKILFSSESFTVGILITDSQYEHKFSGEFTVNEKDIIVLHGQFTSHVKYGEQFEAASFEYDTKPSKSGLAKYLAKNSKFTGIGESKARQIAEYCGDNFEEILFNDPAKIQEIAKVNESVVINLQKEWTSNKDLNYAATQLAGWDLSHKQINKLLEKYGNSIIAIIQKNPYALIDLVDGYGWKKVDELARKTGIAIDAIERIQACIFYVLAQGNKNGHCWTLYDETLENARKELGFLNDQNSVMKIDDQIAVLRDNKKIVVSHLEKPNQETVSIVALKSIYEMEKFLIETFNTVRPIKDHLPLIKNFEDILKLATESTPGLNDKQYQAVLNALINQISLFTGYAGVGKTWVISVIVEILAGNGYSIRLAAPTGKAARRIEESTGKKATTVHRLLEYSPVKQEFTRNSKNPIEADVVILDEISMMSVSLMYHLLKAVDFNRTKLVLVGDHNQLPSVECGNVIRDLINKNALPTIILDKVMRNAGDLRRNSLDILDKGIVNPTTTENCVVEHKHKREKLKCWYVLDNHEKGKNEQVLLTLTNIFQNRLEVHGFDLINDVQVLTPVHDGALGDRSINIFLQKLLQKKLHNFDVPALLVQNQKPKIYPGDKVIQKKNNYDLDIMNGMMGIVLDVTKDFYLIDFGTKIQKQIVSIPNNQENLQHLELGYCTTIHSSQGSEWPCVITLMSSTFPEVLRYRNLLYTAVTRARECTIIMGDKSGIASAAFRKETDRRNTFGQYLLLSKQESIDAKIEQEYWENEAKNDMEKARITEIKEAMEGVEIPDWSDEEEYFHILRNAEEERRLEEKQEERKRAQIENEIKPIAKKVNLALNIDDDSEISERFPIWSNVGK